MKHTTLFEPQLSWPDMDLRTAYGNMFVTNAYVKPFALLTKPKESLTTWWSLCKPNTKQVRGNLERCSPGQVPSSALATPCSFRWPSGIHSDLDLPLCSVPILGGLQQVKLPLAFNIDKTHVKTSTEHLSLLLQDRSGNVFNLYWFAGDSSEYPRVNM